MRLKANFALAAAVIFSVALSVSANAQEKKADSKSAKPGEAKSGEEKTEKAKAEKVAGDIGLLDTEKNYMIVVTKDGKLVTVDFTPKTTVTELKEKPVKMADVGLGSSATVEYTKNGDKNVLSKIEFKPAKGE